MTEHQHKLEEELEQKLNIFQKLKRAGLLGLVGLSFISLLGLTQTGKVGEFMANVQLKSTEEARKGTYIFSESYKNAMGNYFRTVKKYESPHTFLQSTEVAAKGMYMGGITTLVVIEYGLRQLQK